MSDEEKAVGCRAGTGLQPPYTPPHLLALRVSHCLPPQRLFSAARTDEEIDHRSQDLIRWVGDVATQRLHCHLQIRFVQPDVNGASAFQKTFFYVQKHTNIERLKQKLLDLN